MTTTEETQQRKAEKKFTFPSAFTILFLLLVVIAAATWIVPIGSYDYRTVEANPQRLLKSELMVPINGMYGIEARDGNVDVWNSGELFGAIDVALFVLVIGGFLGVTMKTGFFVGSSVTWPKGSKA